LIGAQNTPYITAQYYTRTNRGGVVRRGGGGEAEGTGRNWKGTERDYLCGGEGTGRD